MKKLFLAIRHGDLDEVKETLENYPEVINEPAKAPPKKDDGLSPLQVALKIGEFDIAKYLIEQGADVKYIDPIDQSKKYIWSVPVLQDAIGAVFFAIEKIFNFNDADEEELEVIEKAAEIVRDMLERGADPNALSWKTIETWDKCTLNEAGNAINKCLWDAAHIMHSYPERKNFVVEKLTYLLNLLLEHGADIEEWAKHPAGAYRQDETNRSIFIDDFVPAPDEIVTVVLKGRKPLYKLNGDAEVTLNKGEHKEVLHIENDKDNCAEIRAFMQDFCRKRGLLGLK